ncbi:MAG: lamin tail domain-containing protein, partial [Deltaproteobacteria bacterium]|nr:lamin tail domain-containing protein [Deltaproteobacteria bacterium]
ESEDCLLPETSPCDDSEECTLLDQCDGDGVCTGTPAELIPLAQGGCDDGDPCTADSCLEGGSCDHVDDCPGVPVINEVDYDQPGTDTMEFVEVLNPGPSAVALDLFRLELVNGADGTIYGTFSLDQGLPSRRLDAGKRLVIGSVGVIAALPAGTRSIPLGTVTIQNGAPDGLRIVRKTGSVFVDGVHYEGTMPTVGEGGTAPTDSGTGALGLSRCPDGGDTNNNAVDFLLLPPTPGMVNAPCP